MFDNAEGMVFRPPNEANSLILRVTIGCSHNTCTFCSMYKDVRFRIRPLPEIIALIDAYARRFPHVRRVFLADGDALIAPTDHLLTIMSYLHQVFPRLARITCYGGPISILRKSPEELAKLHSAGLYTVYLGIESGDDEVLQAVNKGVTAAEMTEAGQKILAAEIKLSAMIIIGLGGQTHSRQHAIHTAQVINAINPTFLSALTLMLQPGSALRQAADKGKFQPLSAYALMQEIRLLTENISVAKPCLFRSNHISNILPLAGTFPNDKEALLEEIDIALEHCPSNQLPFYNDKGSF
ncbi:MAG: Radical domain protein [Firmicutes bacterium]|nr:Radical domain protein [Bacillota bacterium]